MRKIRQDSAERIKMPEKQKMVDSTAAAEGEYITAKLIEASPSKRMVVIDEGAWKDSTYEGRTRKRLTVKVQIDGKTKDWSPNKDSAANLNRAFGADTKNWIGKPLICNVVTQSGKDIVNVQPDWNNVPHPAPLQQTTIQQQ